MPMLPLQPGKIARRTHDYTWHGTTTSFALVVAVAGVDAGGATYSCSTCGRFKLRQIGAAAALDDLACCLVLRLVGLLASRPMKRIEGVLFVGGTALLLAVSLAGCGGTPDLNGSTTPRDLNLSTAPKSDESAVPKADEVPEVETREWSVGLDDWQSSGCSGSVTFAAVGDWAKSGDELVRGEDASLSSNCHNDLPGLQDSLLENNPELVDSTLELLNSGNTLQAFMGSYFTDGVCLNLPAVTISGQPGLLCEYDNGDGNNYVQAATLVNETLVLVQGMTTEDDTSEVKSAVLSVSIALD